MRVFYFPVTSKYRIFAGLSIYTEKQVQSQALKSMKGGMTDKSC